MQIANRTRPSSWLSKFKLFKLKLKAFALVAQASNNARSACLLLLVHEEGEGQTIMVSALQIHQLFPHHLNIWYPAWRLMFGRLI